MICGRRIAAVGDSRSTRPPSGALVIDGRGRFVIPGLWDMHVHAAFEPLDTAGPGRSLDENRDYFLPLFVAYGVTSVRDMGGDLALLTTWRAAIARGMLVGPRFIVTGEKLGFVPVVPGAPFPIRSASDVRASVALLAANGAQHVKLDAIDPALVPELAKTCRERGLPFVGHVPVGVSARALSEAGMRSMEHLTGVLFDASPRGAEAQRLIALDARDDVAAHLGRRLGFTQPRADRLRPLVETYDTARATALFATYARNRSWQTPTLRVIAASTGAHDSLFDAAHELTSRPVAPPRRSDEAAAYQRRVFATYAGMLPAMRRAGVGLLAGTDTPVWGAVPGLSLHEELALMVAAGLTPAEALRAATQAAAEAAGAADSLGTLEPGKVADLLLLDGDPLADIRHTRRIRAVIAGGRVLERGALDGFMAAARNTLDRARRVP